MRGVEREKYLRGNFKSQARNPKQIQITEDPNSKQYDLGGAERGEIRNDCAGWDNSLEGGEKMKGDFWVCEGGWGGLLGQKWGFVGQESGNVRQSVSKL